MMYFLSEIRHVRSWVVTEFYKLGIMHFLSDIRHVRT